MNRALIHAYLNRLAELKRIGGSAREGVVSEAFKDLLKGCARPHDLVFVPQYEIAAPTRERRYVDGALLYALRVPFGYWEAKDEKDDLDAEIEHKFKRGYPQDNILFEDSKSVILIQNRHEVMRCSVDDVDALERLLGLFFSYQRPEIAQFRKAVEQLKADLPAVLAALRQMIEREEQANAPFAQAARGFLAHVRDAINPNLTQADVREMLIQHILTEGLFVAVFPGLSFHQGNNVARELYRLEETFFTGHTKYATLKALEPYYAAIRSTAARIESHHEKQSFLKVIYESFYKVYNPKAADRLGVVYTPNEIVRFMIEGADWLCEKHFGLNLIDPEVEILDPATGTGTFICEMIEHFAGQPAKLRHKYHHELHANEVAILPYYVANLNIEATYAATTGTYEEFPGMCFVDTLDNTFALKHQTNRQMDIFSITEANIQRIRQQNKKKISVIIGNPPYNANQRNENENNKNREYPWIDQRIKETYIKASTAQKTKMYDMFVRFFRWASDRLDENGVLAFITNRSFIDKRTFDGFRAMAPKDFCEIYVLDLGGDWKMAGTAGGGNVFGIGTGVAISFMVRKARQKGGRIFYARRPELERAEEKLSFLSSARLEEIPFEEVRPDQKHDWINLTRTDFDTLLPLATKETKRATDPRREKAVFKLFSLGVVTNRDEWVYDESPDEVRNKVKYLISVYNGEVKARKHADADVEAIALRDSNIKWTRAVKNDLQKGMKYKFDSRLIVPGLYRPFIKRWLYYSKQLNEMHYQIPQIFPVGKNNQAICFSDTGSRTNYVVMAVNGVADLHFGASLDAYQQVPLYRYEDGNRIDNITDWALEQFQAHYKPGKGKKAQAITKEAIFHYVYGVLHDPVYREKYAQNLKREFPRIPFYPDFWTWADWGRALMDLHIGYETVTPYKLKRVDVTDDRARGAGLRPKARLKADTEAGAITLDTETTLSGIPKEAWDYRLGNRSALEWVLDQYKEKTPKDPTIREKFDTYRFADHKEQVIDLIGRVTTVSVETVRITSDMALLSKRD